MSMLAKEANTKLSPFVNILEKNGGVPIMC